MRQSRQDAYDELAARILAGDLTFPQVVEQLHIRELKPGVVYGEGRTLSDDVRFAFAVHCLDEIVVDR